MAMSREMCVLGIIEKPDRLQKTVRNQLSLVRIM
jgi:hypothetical protein